LELRGTSVGYHQLQTPPWTHVSEIRSNRNHDSMRGHRLLCLLQRTYLMVLGEVPITSASRILQRTFAGTKV
ncbi:hypothetical protein NDU88_001055, partial [Pleurodeles waltl]